jgi:hypothetical protein
MAQELLEPQIRAVVVEVLLEEAVLAAQAAPV